MQPFLGTLVAACVFTTAAAWGEPLGKRLAPDRPRQAAALGVLLGLVALSRWAFVLSELGVLSRFALLVPLLALALNFRGAQRVGRVLFEGTPGGGWLVVPAVFVLLLLVPVLQAPVVFWDARVYHLGLPEAWIETGRAWRDARFDFSYYPLLAEGLACYAFLAPVADPAAILLALAPLLLVPALASESTDDSIAWLILLGTPAFFSPGLLAKEVALFGVLCLAAHRAKNPWASGAALGAAFASHLYAAVFAPLVLYGWWKHLSRRDLLRAILSAAIVGLPSYLSAFLETGDPLYPFLTVGAPKIEHYPLAALRDLAQGVWEPFGVGSTFGVLLPLGVVFAVVRGPGRRLCLCGAAVLLVVLAQSGIVRYAEGGLLLLAAGAGAGLSTLSGRARRALPLLAAVGLAEMFLLHLRIGRFTPADVVSHRLTPEAYVARFVDEAPLAAWAGTNLPARRCVASLGIVRQSGWKGRLEAVAAWRSPRIAAALRSASGNETAAVRDLRTEGFTHFAVNFEEWRRLTEGYGHAPLTPDEEKTLARLIDSARTIGRSGPSVLLELP